MINMDTDKQMTDSHNSTFSYNSLESIRTKLLDLSKINSLINFKFRKTSSLRFIEADFNRVFSEFLANSQFIISGIKIPTDKELIQAGYPAEDVAENRIKLSAEEWASKLGYSTDYDLASIHIDSEGRFSKSLQTLLFQDDLATIIKKFRQSNQTSLEESGIHILYLVFGFVEWYESRDSSNCCLSPLITLPVELDTSGNQARLSLKDDGSDLLNQTFREKLQHDFGFDLPEFDDQTQSIDQYIDMVEACFLEQGYPKWRVRKNLTLTTGINFSKQVMYQDLDPSAWPSEMAIENHPIIQQIFAKTGQRNDDHVINMPKEYHLDEIEDIEELFPIIYDADSSQHSALIDAIKGKNLVIEGPPGTGKSQTITNLIAACIQQGLTVLFVAEKMAALNVVKSRLDQAGLGQFCLELHSHKANKTAVLEDLNAALNRSTTNSVSQIDQEIAVLHRYREALNHYVMTMNKPWQNTDLTPSQILAKATALKFSLSSERAPLTIEGVTGQNYTPMKDRELNDRVKTLSEIMQKIADQSGSNIADHPWWGLVDQNGDSHSIDRIKSEISDYQALINELLKEGQELSAILKCDLSALDTPFEEMEALYKRLENLPVIEKNVDFSLLKTLLESEEATELTQKYVQTTQIVVALTEKITPNALFDHDLIDKNRQLLQTVVDLGYDPQKTVAELKQESEEIQAIFNVSGTIANKLESLKALLPGNMHCLTNGGLQNLASLAQFITKIDLLPAKLWALRDKNFLRNSLTTKLNELIPSLRGLQEKGSILNVHFDLNHLPAKNALEAHFQIINEGGFFSFLSSEWRGSKAFFNQFSYSKKLNAKRIKTLAPHLLDFHDFNAAIDAASENNLLVQKLYRGLETDVDGIEQLMAWYADIQESYGNITNKPVEFDEVLYEAEYETLSAISEFWHDKIELNYEEFLRLHLIFQEKFPNSDLLSSVSLNINDDSQGYFALQQCLEKVITSFTAHLATLNISLSDFEVALNESAQLQSHLITLEAAQKIPALQSYFNNPIVITDFQPEISARFHELLSKVVELKMLPEPILTALINHCHYDYYQAWQSQKVYLPLIKLHQLVADKLVQLEEDGIIDIQQWSDPSRASYRAMVDKNSAALNHPQSIYTIQEFLHIYEKERSGALKDLLEVILHNNIAPSELLPFWQYSIYHQLGQEILTQSEVAKDFSRFEHEGLRQRFIDADKRLLELQRERIIAKESQKQTPAGISTGAVRQLTETALIRHEASKKTRHIPIRSLLNRAQESIQILKPCFMMSPMSVSQYLEPGKYHFDIMIMDEASQIRPEDAIAAIARADSAVIVGDPKQLPPTSFFQKSSDVDEYDEDTVMAETTESILDTVIPIFTNRRLRWHYRSRHEKLIEFSNYHFYDNDLVVFPSPDNSDQLGIDYRRIDGTFVGSQNREEAQAIIEEVVTLLKSGTEMSIGLVAMNAKQSQLLEDLLEAKTQEDPIFREIYQQDQKKDEPIFIKNLENVQGDERDIIIISMTYGPQTMGGKVPQRFGPINRDAGWRRLNVLFTRAKYRMIIFSSMSSSDVVATEGKRKGVVALKNFLRYCESKQIAGHITVHEGKGYDSDFEEAVAKALRARGFETEPQLGIAGYYLDLAVVNPQNPGEYLLGIECDGATYHSAKSARDRDRLRQQVLEGLGWQIERIWSTDWFKHPEREIDRIVGILKQKIGQ